jgi:hypothetical protein
MPDQWMVIAIGTALTGIIGAVVGAILKVVYAREDIQQKARHAMRSEFQDSFNRQATEAIESRKQLEVERKEKAVLQAEVHDLFRRNVRYANRVEYLEGELRHHEIEFRPWSETEAPKLPPAEGPP